MSTTRVSQGLPKVDTLERPCLVEIHGPNLGCTVPLNAPVTTLGRGADCDVILANDNVSRRHCSIHVAEGAHVLRDDGSTNGTFLNDQPLRDQRLLRAGDLVRLGSVVFKFLERNPSGGLEARYHETIYQLTITDGLTQLYNRRYLIEFLEREMVRGIRHRRPLSVLLLDIDHFKKVNDEHGHLAGDFILRELAALLRGRTRREECLARYGGEEFCLVFPEATRAEALNRAEELRRLCEGTAFIYEAAQIPVTFSGGVAQMEEASTPVHLLKAADDRLYEAKGSGRNRVW